MLLTPTIERKTLSKLSYPKAAAEPQDNGGILKQKSPLVTPKHSILKVSRQSGESTGPFNESFPPEDRFDAFSNLLQMKTADDTNMTSNKLESEDWLTKPSNHSIYNLNNRSRESTPGKSLRFNVPKRIPPKMVELDEDMISHGIVDSDHNSTDSSSLLEICDDSKNDESLQRKTDEKFGIDKPETEEDLVEDKLVVIENSDNKSRYNTNNEKDKVERQYIKQLEDGTLVEGSDTNSEIPPCIGELIDTEKYSQFIQRVVEPTDEDVKSVDVEKHISGQSHNTSEGNQDSIYHLEDKNDQMEEDIKENDNHEHVTSTSMYGEISVYQASDNMSPNNTVITHRIKDIARKSLALDSVNKLDVTDEGFDTVANEQGKDKSYMISDMSVYNPIEAGEKTIDRTIIREMAHEACSQAKDAVYVDEDGQGLNISATAKIPDMSIYEPTLLGEDISVNKPAIRQMAEEAYIKPQELTHIGQTDNSENITVNATDISVYIPSEMRKDEDVRNVAVIRKMAQDAHNEPSEIPQANEKKTSFDSSKSELEMSAYIDNAKRISPDPEVTLNFQIVHNKQDSKGLLLVDQDSAGSIDQAKLYPPNQNPDISVYSIKAGNDSPVQNVDFVKSLATKQIKDIKTKLGVIDNTHPRSFNFSNPEEASPAAAAKHRHRSKLDMSAEMSGSIYLFSEPVVPVSNKQIAKESTQDQVIINEQILDPDKLSKKPEIKEQEPKQEIDVITEDDETKFDIDSTVIKSVGVEIQQANVESTDKKVNKKDQTGLGSTKSDITSFHFSPPVVALGTMHGSLEVDSSFHGWNRYASPPDNEQIQPQFKFTAAESVLPLETFHISENKRNKLDDNDLPISSSRRDQRLAIYQNKNSSGYLKSDDSQQESVHRNSLNKDLNTNQSEEKESAHWEDSQDAKQRKTVTMSDSSTTKSSHSIIGKQKTEQENKILNLNASSQQKNRKGM